VKQLTHEDTKGRMYETYGKDWETVKTWNENECCTLVDDGNGGECFVIGVHWVNRIGYYKLKKSVLKELETTVHIAKTSRITLCGKGRHNVNGGAITTKDTWYRGLQGLTLCKECEAKDVARKAAATRRAKL
jgi:hypothetical protein